MDSMPKLVLQDVSQLEASSDIMGLLKRPHGTPSQIVTAEGHTITYNHQSEIRLGPALYSATIVGPVGDAISKKLDNHLFLAPRSPHHPELGMYALVEWLGDSNGHGSSIVWIVDLRVGKVVTTQAAQSADFVGWRGGISREYIIQEYGGDRSSNWFACDPQAGKLFARHLWNRKRLLFHGGFEGYVSGNGKYLLVLRTRAEVFVALICIESGRVLDLKKAGDFQNYVEDVSGLETSRFDPLLNRLTSMLNWTKTDYQTGKVTFEKLITIEVSGGAEPMTQR